MKISCRVRGDWFQVPCKDGEQMIKDNKAIISFRNQAMMRTDSYLVMYIGMT